MIDLVLATWEVEPQEPVYTPVLPDGCRDVIVRCAPGERPHWFVSELQEGTYAVQIKGGVSMLGFRLKPGVRVNEPSLLAALQRRELDAGEALAAIHDHCTWIGQVSEALDGLACGASSVAEAAVYLGVSVRTLQRLLIAATGRAPSYWLQLARARQAARATLPNASLAEVAYVHGYADQAHMTREFRRWFGLSPRALRCSPALAVLLFETGYA